jgi:hypothetical protein
VRFSVTFLILTDTLNTNYRHTTENRLVFHSFICLGFDERKRVGMEYILTTEDLDQVIESTIVKQKSNKPPTQCKICRASAFYSYCSIVVCPSCKVFFKRNAETKKVRFNHIYIFVFI